MMKKFLFLVLLGYGSSNAQTQIGSDINGEAANDLSGTSISLSFDGNVLAIGGINNDGNGSNSGHVRVYRNISGTWSQIGLDINGEAINDYNGYSVSLSSDGSIVAIGAPWNDGNGSESGQVRVYQNISGTWTQIGTDINGEAAGDRFGVSVSLSSDGNVLAIGANKNDGNGTDSGHVRVYQNISGTWTQIGIDIDGETVYDENGHRVSLSSDGSIIAIGAFNNDENGLNSGNVRIFRNVLGTWTQVGNDINGAIYEVCGWSVSLSSDGSYIAIGCTGYPGSGDTSGRVRIYRNILDNWTQQGVDIIGEAAGDQSGYSVSLSSNGSIVAIGAYGNDGNGLFSGHVRVYRNTSGTWSQIGSDVNGEAINDYSGYSVSLSSDGSVLAIGAIYNSANGTNSGHVRVYDLTEILASDSFVQSKFSIYPNPSNGILNIALENNFQLEKVNFYNQSGQLVKTATTDIISTLDLTIGTYFVEVVTNQGKATKKIIVE